MNRNIFSFLLAAMCMFIGVVSVEADTTTTSQDFRLATVKFVGVRQVSQKQLAENLAAKTPTKWKFWKPKPTLNRTDLEEDLLRIKQFYQRKGYYRATADFTIIEKDAAIRLLTWADPQGKKVYWHSSAHLMAVSNRSVGGAITVGIHAGNGHLVVPWLSWSRYATPVP